MARRASRDLRREGYVVEGRRSGMREEGVHCGGERWGGGKREGYIVEGRGRGRREGGERGYEEGRSLMWGGIESKERI